jgi:hypothetical protein
MAPPSANRSQHCFECWVATSASQRCPPAHTWH